jgi:hypothetical protein
LTEGCDGQNQRGRNRQSRQWLANIRIGKILSTWVSGSVCAERAYAQSDGRGFVS